MPCVLARSWVAKLTLASPAGYQCGGKSYTCSRRQAPTISAACWKGPTKNPFSPSNTGYIGWASAPTRG
jgi:hypothetical protein